MDDEGKGNEKRAGLVEKVKRIYVERPTAFALVVMCGSAVALVVGVFMLGDFGASTLLAPGPMSP